MLGYREVSYNEKMGYLFLLADVFSAQHLPAGFALKAAEMPLSPQSQQSLAIFDISTTAGAI